MKLSYESYGKTYYFKYPKNWFSKDRNQHKYLLLNFDAKELRDHYLISDQAYDNNTWSMGACLKWETLGHKLFQVSLRYKRYLTYLNKGENYAKQT